MHHAHIAEIHGKEVPMSTGKKVKVGIVGLGFGAEFVPLYQKHPDAECYAICQRNEARVLDSAMPASRPKVRAAWPEVDVPMTR